MKRYEIMQQIKVIYEEIVNSCDIKSLLGHENEMDKLYHDLYVMEGEAYSPQETELLNELFELNQTLQSLMSGAMNQMQRAHHMSVVVQKQYDNNFYSDSYFFDKKY